MNNVFSIKKQMVTDSGFTVPQVTNPSEVLQEPALPDYLSNFKTKNTIPAFFREAGVLPDRLAVSTDRTPATKVVNQSYERQKKIEQKKATENAI